MRSTLPRATLRARQGGESENGETGTTLDTSHEKTVSHHRRRWRTEAGEDDSEEDETPVVIPPSAVKIYRYTRREPQCQHRPLRYKCSKREWTSEQPDMAWRQMIGVGVRRVVLAREEGSRKEALGDP